MTVPLNINRVVAKYLGIMTSEVLPTSSFHYKAKKKNTKLSVPKMMLSGINTSFPVRAILKNV